MFGRKKETKPQPQTEKKQPAKAQAAKKPAPQAAAKAVRSRAVNEPEFSWESSRIEQIEKSERRAWNVAKAFGVFLLLSIAALALLMPLKTVEPFVIEVDKNTGMSEVLHIANTEDIPASEMMDKYWVSQYITKREGYDWRTLHVDFLQVRELSMPNVFDSYASQYGADKKTSLEQTLRDDKRIVVKVNSLVINHSAPDGVATVRFTKDLISNRTGATEGRNSWIATVGFEYFPDFKVPEERRLVNPFGFKITSYRVDPEITQGGH